MVYGILTKLGTPPFKQPETPPTAPGDPLVLSEHATLVGFVNQPDRVFARQSALTYGCILWYLTADVLERNALESEMEFSSCREFDNYLRHREKG